MAIRDNLIDHLDYLNKRSSIPIYKLVKMTGIAKQKYYRWKKQTGQDNRHNNNLPKSNWLLPWEKEAIINYAKEHHSDNDFFLRDGYRRLTFQMLDKDIVAVSPSSVYRILKEAKLLNRWKTKGKGKKGNGFQQPNYIHRDWHVDIKYVNLRGCFLYLICVLDGFSRYIVHHELRMNMTEYDVELTIQRAKEKYPKAKPRIISDNGSQFISKDFREFIRYAGLTHIKTSIAYPQSNGKLERFHRSIGIECLNTKSFIDIEDAQKIIAEYVDHYNNVRLHASLFYLTPEDFLNDSYRDKLKAREEKLSLAADRRARQWKKEAA